MNSKFDLNILNYKKEELEDIFELSPNYNLHKIETNASKLRDNILEDKSLSVVTRDNTITFIVAAKEVLINSLKKIMDADFYNISTNLKPSIIKENDYIDHPLIERKKTPYGQSFPSEFYQGTINPLKKRVLNKSLNIDTRFRENYYTTLSTNYHLDLPVKFSNVLSLQLSAFEFPATYYTISSKSNNNFFWITGNNTDASGELIESAAIIIPDGNYNPVDLIDFINNFIKISFASYILLSQVSFVLNVGGGTAQSGSGQVIVGTNQSGVAFNLSLNFQADVKGNPDYSTPLPLKLGWMMGFREGYYKNNTSYVGEGICDTSGPNYMYLVIDDYNNNVNNNFYSAYNSSILNKNIIARISLQAPYFNTLSQNNLGLITLPRQYFGPVDIQKLNIQLLNEYGTVINLNNMDYSFCLTIQTVYDL